MANYTVIEGKHPVTNEPAWFVTFADSNSIGTGQTPYRNEESAKRRVRDLKRKDAAEHSAAPATIAVPTIRPGASIIIKTPIVRTAGVYPAVSKHSYQR